MCLFIKIEKWTKYIRITCISFVSDCVAITFAKKSLNSVCTFFWPFRHFRNLFVEGRFWPQVHLPWSEKKDLWRCKCKFLVYRKEYFECKTLYLMGDQTLNKQLWCFCNCSTEILLSMFEEENKMFTQSSYKICILHL